jgi:hypothetical protein
MDCQIELDASKSALDKKFYLTDVEFRHRKIIYRGGMFAFPENGFWRFVNCAFELAIQGRPSNPGQRLIESLISAHNLQNVKITSGA